MNLNIFKSQWQIPMQFTVYIKNIRLQFIFAPFASITGKFKTWWIFVFKLSLLKYNYVLATWRIRDGAKLFSRGAKITQGKK